MNQSCYIKLNNEFRDVRLSWIKKLEEMKAFISMVEEYQANNPSSDLSELKLPVCIHQIKKMVRIHLDNPEKRHVFIRGNNGRYLSGENGERHILCNREVPLGWEKFIIENVGNGKVALKSMNKYVSSEDGKEAITCNRGHADVWEFFEMIENGDGTFSFKGNNGKYISSENGKNPVTCWVEKIQEWEKFHFEDIKSPADEVEMSWKAFNQHFSNLCKEVDEAFTAKQNINPENYFFTKAITVHHEGHANIEPYETHHQERRFNEDSFKKDMKKADARYSHAKWHLNEQYHFLYHLLEDENAHGEMVSKMYSNIYPAKAFLEAKKSETTKNEELQIEIETAKSETDSDVDVLSPVHDAEDDCLLVF